MTTFKEIRGQLIRSVSSDPANPQIGQIWYNNTTGVLKGYVTVASTFSSGGNRNDGQNSGGSAGTLTAGLAFGGNRNPGLPNTGGLALQTQSEEYNGSSWTEGGAMSQGRATFGGGGTQTAALAFGGRTTNNPFTYTNLTEEYNGSSWTSGGNLGSTAYYMNRSGCGTQTAGLCVGGINNIPGTADQRRTEEYDGSSWTTVNDMVADSLQQIFLGSQTSGILLGGSQPGAKTAIYNYDGTNWTTNPASSINGLVERSGIGTASAALLAGGSPYAPSAFNSELWNGTAFANDATIATQRGSAQSSSASTSPVAGYITSGSNPTTPASALTSTEVYTAAFNAARTLTTS